MEGWYIVYRHLGSDWWPFREHEEQIGKERIGIKLQELEGMLVPCQI